MNSRVIVDAYGNPIKKRRPSPRVDFRNSGYGNAGASLTKNVFKGWEWRGGSPDDDIVQNLPIIRQRSRQLSMESPIIAGLYKTLTTNCIGDGLRPEPTPDAEFLEMTPESARRWKANVLRRWESFAESVSCDALRRDNFYELTRLVSRAQDESGDVFVAIPRFARANDIFDLKIQVIEADCVANPDGAEALEHIRAGNDVTGGVETSPTGAVVGYWIYSGHPLELRKTASGGLSPRWRFIPAFGAETGRPNVLHLMESTRPGQKRGLPLISPVIEIALILDRYLKAESIAAHIQAMFTLIVTSESPDAMAGEMASLGGGFGEEATGGDDGLIALGNGIVQYARPGESVTPVNPSRPTTSFAAFVQSVIEMIGPAVGVPYEMLMQKFDASYSASRAAMNMAASAFKVKRSGLINDFCSPIYEAFFDECVAKGMIEAPGYWDSPVSRRAYTRAKWNGPGMPQIDLLKEVEAAEKRIALGFSTASEATSELTGGDWFENVEARQRELEAAKKAGIIPPSINSMNHPK